MAPKKQVHITPLQDDERREEPEGDTEELEVQVKQAMRTKGVAGHVENGKKIQAKGVEARKQNGYASQREKKLAAEQKKNDRLERMKNIEEAEEAERERSERLSGGKKQAPPVPIHATTDKAPNYDDRLARIEELLQARQAEAAAPKKKASKAKLKPAPKEEETSEEEEELPPRQKQVRKSAKTEMKKKSGAIEESIHSRSHLPGNPGKQKAMLMDQEARWRELAANLLPGSH